MASGSGTSAETWPPAPRSAASASACGRALTASRAAPAALEGVPPDDVLGTVLFSGNDNLVRDVMVGGAWVVRDRQHVEGEAITRRYKQTIAELRALRA